MPLPSIRIFYFSTWADDAEDAAHYLKYLPKKDISSLVIRPDDSDLVHKARLECDWEAENLCSFAAMYHPSLQFAEAQVVGTAGLSRLAKETAPSSEMWWLIFIGQQPQIHAGIIGKVFRQITKKGHKIFYWSFDEASRKMSCFKEEVAPYISVLVHDEAELDETIAATLPADCIRRHNSWLANIVPFSLPWSPTTKPQIVFLGSSNGLSPHRQAQIKYLRDYFKETFLPIFDASIPVFERSLFNQYHVHWCPEGQHFTTFSTRYTHTDRVFWSGCLGQVPVVENSRWGGRLDPLLEADVIYRYEHGDLKGLTQACELALQTPHEKRREIYNYFNTHQTIGPLAAELIFQSTSL